MTTGPYRTPARPRPESSAVVVRWVPVTAVRMRPAPWWFRLLCRAFGHRWGAWNAGGVGLPILLHRLVGLRDRQCAWCGLHEFQRPATHRALWPEVAAGDGAPS